MINCIEFKDKHTPVKSYIYNPIVQLDHYLEEMAVCKHRIEQLQKGIPVDLGDGKLILGKYTKAALREYMLSIMKDVYTLFDAKEKNAWTEEAMTLVMSIQRIYLSSLD